MIKATNSHLISFRGMIIEQFRFLWVRDRWQLGLLLVLSLVLSNGVVYGSSHVVIQFSLLMLWAIWAENLWKDEPPDQRDYYSMLPTSHFSQHLSRILAGAIWIIVLLLIVLIIRFIASIIGLTPEFVSEKFIPQWILLNRPGIQIEPILLPSWIYLSWFVSGFTFFFSVSAVALAAKRPAVWIARVVIVIICTLLFTDWLEYTAIHDSIRSIFTGTFGLYHSLFPTHRFGTRIGGFIPASSWANLLPALWWLTASIALVLWTACLRKGKGIKVRFILSPATLIGGVFFTTLLLTVLQLYFNVVWNNQAKTVSSRGVEIIELSYKQLWDPTSIDIEDWQILKRPSQLIQGLENELILTDTGNSRVLRISQKGELVDVIGRKGQGPGEFLDPQDLFYNQESSLLWVADRSYMSRINTFYLSSTDSEYKDTYTIQSLFGSSPGHGMVQHGEDAIWFSPKLVDSRLVLAHSNGELIHQVGEQWIPDDIRRGSLWLFNQGYVTQVRSGVICFAWMFQPKIEFWTQNGVKILERDFLDLPEVMKRRKEKIPDGAVVNYMQSVSCGLHNKYLYWQVFDTLESIVIYALLVTDLSPVRKYICNFDQHVRISSIVVIEETENIEFYCLDIISDTIIKLEPSQTFVETLEYP